MEVCIGYKRKHYAHPHYWLKVKRLKVQNWYKLRRQFTCNSNLTPWPCGHLATDACMLQEEARFKETSMQGNDLNGIPALYLISLSFFFSFWAESEQLERCNVNSFKVWHHFWSTVLSSSEESYFILRLLCFRVTSWNCFSKPLHSLFAVY